MLWEILWRMLFARIIGVEKMEMSVQRRGSCLGESPGSISSGSLFHGGCAYIL